MFNRTYLVYLLYSMKHFLTAEIILVQEKEVELFR
jgi:hypothetical protein